MKQLHKPFTLTHSFIFIFFLAIFTILDYLNVPYPLMWRQSGTFVVMAHLLLNLTMAFLSLHLYRLNEDFTQSIGKEVRGSNASFLATIFGIFTYGCTPCVIGFLAMFGVNFVVIALPWANLPYKLISLAIIIIGILFANHQLKKSCTL